MANRPTPIIRGGEPEAPAPAPEPEAPAPAPEPEAPVATYESETLELGALPTSHVSGRERAKRTHYDGLVRTAPRDKATVWYMPQDKTRGFSVSIAHALKRCGLRGIFETGSGQRSDDGRWYVYLKPKAGATNG